MAIITTTQYKAWAGITDAGFDTRLAIIIPAVQSTLEDYCGRLFDSDTYADEKYDGNGEQSLWLKNFPVTALSAVKSVASDGTETTLSADSYRFTARGELHRLSSNEALWGTPVSFMRTSTAVWDDSAPENLLVSYTGGYSTMPASLELLMYTLVDAAVDQAGESWMLSATGDGTETKTFLNPTDINMRYASLAREFVRRMVV